MTGTDRTREADGPMAEAVLDPHRMAAARLWATNRFPYLASAIFATPTMPAPGIGRVVIDRWWRVHADPEVVARADVASLGGELVHLIGHVLRDHASRADAVGLAEQAELHHWVDAADAELADDAPPGVTRLSADVAPADLDCEPARLVEEYYRQGSVRDGMTNDCGSGAHGRPPSWEPPPPAAGDKGLTKRDQDQVRRQVAAAITQARADEVAAGLRRWADEHLRATVDWRAELAAVIRRAVAEVAGAADYSYRRPSRRAAVMGGIVLPALRRPTVEVAVVCDTSASVSDELLAGAVAEIDGLLRATGTRSLRVLACDDAVRATSRVVDVGELALIGGGGTDLSIGIDAAIEHRPSPQLVVVVTDGYTPWPAEVPPARVVVALLATDEPLPPPDPPPWAHTVHIDTDDRHRAWR